MKKKVKQEPVKTPKAKKTKTVKQSPADQKPTTVTDVDCLWAKIQTDDSPKLTSRSGKWLIFVSPKSVDGLWDKIRKATEEGKLGHSAKVSTAKGDPEVMVIRVYTYDWTDEKDVRRIREQLKALGIIKKISYKADSDTLARKYNKNGRTKVTKYHE